MLKINNYFASLGKVWGLPELDFGLAVAQSAIVKCKFGVVDMSNDVFKPEEKCENSCSNCGFDIEDYGLKHERRGRSCPSRCGYCGDWSFDCRCDGGMS